jgi:hypothetical protein
MLLSWQVGAWSTVISFGLSLRCREAATLGRRFGWCKRTADHGEIVAWSTSNRGHYFSDSVVPSSGSAPVAVEQAKKE